MLKFQQQQQQRQKKTFNKYITIPNDIVFLSFQMFA